MIGNRRENYSYPTRAGRKGTNEGERRPSHHMPRVDTLALNSLAVAGEYTRTEAGALAPSTVVKAVCLASGVRRGSSARRAGKMEIGERRRENE
jgi:hypothetical protein